MSPVTQLRSPLAKVRREGKLGRTDAPKSLTFVERMAFFICAKHRDEALTLFESLAEPERTQARRFARDLNELDSATRQARLTLEFGMRVDAADRVAQLVVEAPVGLRGAIFNALPPTLAQAFPHLANATAEVTPAMKALAERLVREALR